MTKVTPSLPLRNKRTDMSGARLNVVYFSLNFPELSQTFVYNEMRSLRDADAVIRVVALRQEQGEASDLPQRYGFGKAVDYIDSGTRKASKWHRLREMIAAFSHLRGTRFLGLAKNAVARFSRIEHLRALLLQIRLAAILQPAGTNPIIHCHFGPAGRMVAELRKAGLVTAPFTTVFHGFDITKYVDKHGEGTYRELFKQADLLLPISNLWHQKLLEIGAPAAKVHTQRLGIDCTSFSFKERFITPGTPLRFISVGRMTEKKGHAYAIEAFVQLVKRRPDLNLQLDVVGAGPLFQSITELASKHALTNCVILHGSLQHSAVRTLLDEAHVFVLPSVTAADGDMEGIPVAIMEAMAMGLAVISTHHSGIPELVAAGKSGLLVPERDVMALSASMERLATEPHEIAAMGRQGRQIVELDYNSRIQAAKLKKLLSSLGENDWNR